MEGILKQSSWLFFGQVFVKLVSFFYTIFLANALGVSNFGLLSAVLAYLMLASTLSDFGFNRFLIKEIARKEAKRGELIFNISLLRLLFSLLIIVLLVVFLFSFDSDKNKSYLVVLGALSLIPLAITQSLEGFFVAIRKVEYGTVVNILTLLLIYLVSIILIKLGLSVKGLIIAQVTGQFFSLSLYLLLIKFRFPLKLVIKKNLALLGQAVKGSLPYGLLAVMGLLYFRIDTLMLNYMRGNFETGIYSAGYKFLEAVIFVPEALSVALFPVMSGMHEKVGELKKLYLRSVFLMITLGFLTLIGYLLILPTVISLFLPGYLPSIGVVKILAFSIPFIFLYVPASEVLLSSDRYLKQIVFISVLNLLFNLILNILFIPQYGYIAAAWITVASDIFSFAALFLFLQKVFFKNV